MNENDWQFVVDLKIDMSDATDDHLEHLRATMWALADEIRLELLRRAARRDADSERKRASAE